MQFVGAGSVPGPHGRLWPTFKPAASALPSNNGQMSFDLTNDASLAAKVNGGDGTVRSAVRRLA